MKKIFNVIMPISILWLILNISFVLYHSESVSDITYASVYNPKTSLFMFFMAIGVYLILSKLKSMFADVKTAVKERNKADIIFYVIILISIPIIIFFRKEIYFDRRVFKIPFLVFSLILYTLLHKIFD